MSAALQAAADALGVEAPEFTATSGKGLEAEVLFRFALAARARSARVIACSHTGHKLTGRFELRGGPGHFVDPSATGVQPSYFSVAYGETAFELHNSVQYRGASGVLHETDVSAVSAPTAQIARYLTPRVASGPPEVGAELKDFKPGSSVDKNVVRALLACVVDFVPTWAVGVLGLGGPGRYNRAFTPGPRPDDQFFLFTSGHLSQPSHDLAAAYNLQVVDTLDPTQFQHAIDAMARRLEGVAAYLPPGPPPAAPTVSWRWRKLADGRLLLQIRPQRRIRTGRHL